MTFLSSWEEFSKAAERLYINDPAKTELVCKDPCAFARRLLDMPSSSGSLERCRFVTKYRHCDGKLEVKITDDSVCLQYRTEHAQDIKRLEKLTSQLMRHMASKEK